jgi:hypothetical protein
MAQMLAAATEPIFLLGTTRSGSTLLSLILGEHSQVAFAGEFQWVFDNLTHDSPFDPADYFHRLQKDRFFQAHRPEIDLQLGFDELCRSILHQMHADSGSSRRHVLVSVHRHYKRVHEIWPKARFIHLVRDGRDVCASWLKLGWHGTAWSGAREWQRLIREWQELRPELKEHQFIEVRLEDLVANPSKLLRSVCSMLDVDFEPAMLEFHEHSSYAPVTPGRVGTWEQKLTESQVNLVETIAESELRAFDYPLLGSRRVALTPMYEARLRLEDRIRRLAARAREFGLVLWISEALTRRLGPERLHRALLQRMYRITNARLE